MYPIPQLPAPHCDCCGLPVAPQAGDFCPRCGYPVGVPQEEHFLEESIRNLQRVATYGGAQATVSNLLLRYQKRLSAIRQQLSMTSAKQNLASIPYSQPNSQAVQPQPMGRPVAPPQPNNLVPPAAQIPPVHPNEQPQSQPQPPQVQPVPPVQMPIPPVSSAPQHVFSLRSFFADQTINIVSSLGAFLILVGSLSFVATTSNLFLSFLVLFLVHLIFAIVGFVFSRFPSFRFISRIYTAIFALLVPLVGFSSYRLVAGHLIELSAPTVVAIAAVYAAIVYTALAISQQYKPFGYFAAVALVVAGCAVAFALQLAYWWWPVLLMPLAFVVLLSLSNNSQLFSGNRALLREPLRILMYVCLGLLCLDVFCTSLYVLTIGAISHPLSEIRVAGATMLFLVLGWTCVHLWLTKQRAWIPVLPYQFLGFVVALACVFDLRAVFYGLLLTAIAIFYHVLTLVARKPLLHLQFVRNHIDAIALVLVAFVPFLVAAQVPLDVAVAIVYGRSTIPFFVNGDTLLALIALVGSCALTMSIIVSHTGFRRIPASRDIAWPWLMLLSGLLFTWAYGTAILSLHIVPVYAFLALTLVLLLGTIVVRSYISVAWSNPLDVLVLAVAILALLLQLSNGADDNFALLFLFAVLSYSVVLYQRRYVLLFLPLVFMLLALPALLQLPRIMLLLGIGLPLVGLLLAMIESQRSGYATANSANVSFRSLFSWQWPILASGLLYGLVVCGFDAFAPISTLQSWLAIPFSVALEIAVFALIWYIVAVVTRQQWLLIITTVFAIAGLLVPSNPLWVTACVAGVAALVALGMGRVVARLWVAPLYVIALIAAILVGLGGYTGGQLLFVSWVLLGFAVLLYVIGAVENFIPSLWLASAFAIWSVWDAALLGEVYRPFVIVLLCAAVGVSIARVALASKFVTPEEGRLLSLPLYITALVTALLTGIYSASGSINIPFPTAIPDALLLYAVVAYVVLVFERQSRLLWLVALFALWGMVLVLRLDTDVFKSFSAQVAFPTYYLTAVALVAGIIALVIGRLSKTRDGAPSLQPGAFLWSWPWYCTALFAIVLTVIWNTLMRGIQVSGVTVYGSLFAFILLAFIVMFVERRHELFFIPVSLVLWATLQVSWQLWQQIGLLSLLFFLVFAMRYVWQLFPTQRQNVSLGIVYTLIGFGGQLVLLFTVIGQGGLSPDARPLANIGIGILLLLAVQLFLYGWASREKQYWTLYLAGLLVTLAIPWELSTFQFSRIEWLTLAPATYLIVVAPFLSRNEHVPYHARLGQLCSILGASLLLLPTLWSSFSEPNIGATFILAGEALALLLLGVVLRTRFFVLSGTALVIVSAMHALFLPSLGLPPSLALTIMGVTLLALATALSLARHRLQAVWTHLD